MCLSTCTVHCIICFENAHECMVEYYGDKSYLLEFCGDKSYFIGEIIANSWNVLISACVRIRFDGRKKIGLTDKEKKKWNEWNVTSFVKKGVALYSVGANNELTSVKRMWPVDLSLWTDKITEPKNSKYRDKTGVRLCY